MLKDKKKRKNAEKEEVKGKDRCEEGEKMGGSLTVQEQQQF